MKIQSAPNLAGRRPPPARIAGSRCSTGGNARKPVMDRFESCVLRGAQARLTSRLTSKQVQACATWGTRAPWQQRDSRSRVLWRSVEVQPLLPPWIFICSRSLLCCRRWANREEYRSARRRPMRFPHMPPPANPLRPFGCRNPPGMPFIIGACQALLRPVEPEDVPACRKCVQRRQPACFRKSTRSTSRLGCVAS